MNRILKNQLVILYYTKIYISLYKINTTSIMVSEPANCNILEKNVLAKVLR